MKAQILYDEGSREAHLFTGWGFSVLIGPYLFDTGEKGVPLLENMKRLQVSIYDIDSIIISHDHWDHWGGLWDILPLRPNITVYGGANFSREFINKVKDHGGVYESISRLTKLNENIFITDEMTGTHKGKQVSEISLAVQTEKGLSLCTGCAHPGIVEIAEKAISMFPEAALNTVFGGFHLHQETHHNIEKTIEKLFNLGFTSVYPGHCSGNFAKTHASAALYTGMIIEL